MRDRRIQRWAEVLVHYSLEAKKGQHAVLAGDVDGLPLVEACYEKLLQAGVFVETFITPTAFKEIQFQHASDEQITSPLRGLLHAVEQCDLYVHIGSDHNTKLLTNFAPYKHSLASKARQPILESILNRAAEQKMRWVYTYFPTAAAAQAADMGTLEYEEFIFSLGHLNEENPVQAWQQAEQKQQKLIDRLHNKSELHFQNAQGTDLRVNGSGMQ